MPRRRRAATSRSWRWSWAMTSCASRSASWSTSSTPPASISCSWNPTRRRDSGTTDDAPSPRGPRRQLLGGRGLAAGIRGFRRADLEAGGDHRGRRGLLVEDVVEDLDRLVGHLVGPLADIVV